MSFRQVIADLVCEKTVARLRLQLTDENDDELPKAQLSSLKLTLYVSSKGSSFGQIINSREAQSILDANGATVSADGLVSLLLGVDDNALSSQTRGFEQHTALFEWSWDSGARIGRKEVTYTVANQAKVS